LQYHPEVSKAVSDSQGRARGENLDAGIKRERKAQLDTNVRAERFAAYGNRLEVERANNFGVERREAREKIEMQMLGVVAEIGKDAAARSVRSRKTSESRPRFAREGRCPNLERRIRHARSAAQAFAALRAKVRATRRAIETCPSS
jgi:hypothetical protein